MKNRTAGKYGAFSCADVRPVCCCGLLPDVQKSHASKLQGTKARLRGKRGMFVVRGHASIRRKGDVDDEKPRPAVGESLARCCKGT